MTTYSMELTAPTFDTYSNILNGHAEDAMIYEAIDSGVKYNFIALLYYQEYFIGCSIVDDGKSIIFARSITVCNATLTFYLSLY